MSPISWIRRVVRAGATRLFEWIGFRVTTSTHDPRESEQGRQAENTDGPPLHWLERVQQDAPGFLESLVLRSSHAPELEGRSRRDDETGSSSSEEGRVRPHFAEAAAPDLPQTGAPQADAAATTAREPDQLRTPGPANDERQALPGDDRPAQDSHGTRRHDPSSDPSPSSTAPSPGPIKRTPLFDESPSEPHRRSTPVERVSARLGPTPDTVVTLSMDSNRPDKDPDPPIAGPSRSGHRTPSCVQVSAEPSQTTRPGKGHLAAAVEGEPLAARWPSLEEQPASPADPRRRAGVEPPQEHTSESGRRVAVESVAQAAPSAPKSKPLSMLRPTPTAVARIATVNPVITSSPSNEIARWPDLPEANGADPAPWMLPPGEVSWQKRLRREQEDELWSAQLSY